MAPERAPKYSFPLGKVPHIPAWCIFSAVTRHHSSLHTVNKDYAYIAAKYLKVLNNYCPSSCECGVGGSFYTSIVHSPLDPPPSPCSANAVFDNKKAVRGGIPVVFRK